LAKAKCVLVRAAGRQLDELRLEASRIAKGKTIDWWVDRTDRGVHFCFEDADAMNSFAVACERFGLPHQEA
jgi:hypothetical protein